MTDVFGTRPGVSVSIALGHVRQPQLKSHDAAACNGHLLELLNELEHLTLGHLRVFLL
jgi:hypothetical protein